MHNLRLLSRPLTKNTVKVSFQDHLSKVAEWTKFDFFRHHRLKKWENGRFFQDHRGWIPKVDSFKTLPKRVKILNPRYMVPVNEASQVISDLRQQRWHNQWKISPRVVHHHKDQDLTPSTGAQIYIHRQYQGSSSIVPQQLWHVRRIHHDRPYSPSSTTQKTESSHWVQGGDQKRAGRDGMLGNHHQTDWAHTMGQLSHIPQKGNSKLMNLPQPKGLEQSHHPWESQDSNPWGDNPCTHRSNQIFQGGRQQSFLWNAPDRGSFTPHIIQHTLLTSTDFSVPFRLKMSQDIFQMRMDDIAAQCPGALAIHDNVFILWEGWQRPWCQHHQPVQCSPKRRLIFNSSKCSIKQDSVTFFGGMFSANDTHQIRKDPRHHRDDTPSNEAELQLFWGAVNYLQTFVPHLSHHTEPLHALLKRRTALHGMRTWTQVSRKLNPHCRKHCWNPSGTTQKQTSHPQCDTSLKVLEIASSKMANHSFCEQVSQRHRDNNMPTLRENS